MALAVDTLGKVKRLIERGFTEEQAEALVQEVFVEDEGIVTARELSLQLTNLEMKLTTKILAAQFAGVIATVTILAFVLSK